MCVAVDRPEATFQLQGAVVAVDHPTIWCIDKNKGVWSAGPANGMEG